MSAYEEERLTIHVKNMAGEIHTITCCPTASISQIYDAVCESLEEPRPAVSDLRLLHYDEDQDEYVPLQTLSDNMQISLFIEAEDIRVVFSFNDCAIVGFPYPSPSPLYMEGESFEIIQVDVFVTNKLSISFPFLVRVGYTSDDKRQYTEICYHREDTTYQLSYSERRNGGWDEMLFTINDSAISGQTPADLIMSRYTTNLTIAGKVETEWLDYIATRTA